MRIFQQVAATGKHFYSTLYESDFLPLVQICPHAITLVANKLHYDKFTFLVAHKSKQ